MSKYVIRWYIVVLFDIEDFGIDEHVRRLHFFEESLFV